MSGRVSPAGAWQVLPAPCDRAQRGLKGKTSPELPLAQESHRSVTASASACVGTVNWEVPTSTVRGCGFAL